MVLKRHMVTDGDNKKREEREDEYDDSDDERDQTLGVKMSRYVKLGMYYVTDSERFQPPRKLPKYVQFGTYFFIWVN